MHPPIENADVVIRCLTDTITLKDLGVTLSRGAQVTVSSLVATKSRELTQAKLNGSVSTQTVKSAPPRAQEHTSSDTTTPQSPRYTPTPQMDFSPVLVALENLTNEVRRLRQDIAARPIQPALDLTPLISALRALPVAGLPERQASPVVDPTEPLYIPDLGSGLSSENVVVNSGSSINPEMDASIKALKDRKKRVG